MATGLSSLTRSNGVRRTGGRNKFQLESPSPDSVINLSTKKGSNQGDSDSEFTAFTSSIHDSASSASSSIDRNRSEMEGQTQRKKPLEKFNSKKRWSFRLSKKNPQSPSTRLPDDGSATRRPWPVEISGESPVRKPVLKITRSGSLRSLKIVRNRSKSSSSESKGPIPEDLRSNRATFSSILKDSKFPEPQESEEILPGAKLCPYQHCSLHGHHHHHHHHEPPVKRFSFLKRRSSKDQKGVNPKTHATIDNSSTKKSEAKLTKKGSKSKKHEKAIKEDVDCSIEFYEKTRTEHILESSSGLDDANLANIMFGVNGNDQKEVQKPDSIKGNQLSMWRLIQQHMVSDLVPESGCELDQQTEKEKQSCTVDDSVNQENENRKMFVIKIVRDAIKKVLPEVPDQSITTTEVISEKDEKTEHLSPDGWSHIKKVTLLKKFITELEKVKRFDPNKRALLPLVPESESETVSLRPQTVHEKKSSDDWMLDYALQKVVSELSPTQKRKVSLLVKAFESVAPKVNDLQEQSLTDYENGDDYKEKEKYMKMWHMVYQHVVTDITTKLGSELLHDDDDDDDDEQEVKDMLLIRQSVNEILVPEVEEEDDGGESQIPENWNKLRTLRRSIKELESFRQPKPERQVDLRRQKSREKTKAEEWMIDYAVQHIVTKLTPARKKRVSMLVEAFESVIPLPQT